ncbi:hypothetical protein [Corallococcus silvisoli]|uniref:hypothetical protein n=1 Tax=Corallococcus silvisoli TaxID=2697031 RepID=UPI0013781F76|nr:hypothetical protein [Corallococcus silvisoli]NBD11774.1 hypothetical protein [Corallococcus silvisoli]
MDQAYRYIPSLLALACMACATGRSASPPLPRWPLPGESVRWEPVPGVSVIAPPLPPAKPEPERSATHAECKHLDPSAIIDLASRATTLFVCSWYHHDSDRQLRMDWSANIFDPEASPEDNLQRLEREQVRPFAGTEYTRLPAPWVGWEWHKAVREWGGPGPGENISDRWIVVGRGLLFLQTISLENDPFPEGEAFLDSLRVTATEQR